MFGSGVIHMGHSLVYLDGWDSEQVLAKVERHRVTNSHMVPTQFKRLLSLPEEAAERYASVSQRTVQVLEHIRNGEYERIAETSSG